MSVMAQVTALGEGAASPILSIDHQHAHPPLQVAPHTHSEPMLLWASTTSVTLRTVSHDWLVPPGHGLWIPGRVEHTGTTRHAGELCVIRFMATRCPIDWAQPTGVAVGPLLRELIRYLRAEPDAASRRHAEALLFEVLLPLPTHSIQVPIPAEPRLRTITERLIDSPGDQRQLAMWAAEVHSGVRTLSRLFLAETGLTFSQWRTRVRVRAAVGHLAAGASVKATARAVGYRKPSAFIAAFQRVTGQTPGTYGGE
ncbi:MULTISPECIES: helix-turn-helix transcriptional regulator [Streptomyces]|uniref:helix-turn-helix transcriptional regulator n=1 Tax=Streptomyces TaxID=1883 RepID=UPI001B30915D|nr:MULTISPECIES: AraC family transcriptional regulator [Streptomyces]MDX2625325.1 AraC family transcriptional regulator [Streptomyces scabiei]